MMKTLFLKSALAVAAISLTSVCQAQVNYPQPAFGQPAYGQPVYGQPNYGQPQPVAQDRSLLRLIGGMAQAAEQINQQQQMQTQAMIQQMERNNLQMQQLNQQAAQRQQAQAYAQQQAWIAQQQAQKQVQSQSTFQGSPDRRPGPQYTPDWRLIGDAASTYVGTDLNAKQREIKGSWNNFRDSVGGIPTPKLFRNIGDTFGW